MRRLGVDEAGKGPVLGAMITAAVLADPEALPESVADSKTLSPDQRSTLDATIQSRNDVDVGIAYVPVSRIDDPATDMNTLTVDAHAAAIRAIPADFAGRSGVLDASDVDPDRFTRRVTDRVPTSVNLEARHEADTTDPVVGAASIVAKVARDAHIESIATNYDTPLGSGYPSDPVTRRFLAEFVDTHDRLPACARRSWQTSRDALAARTQASLSEF